MLTCAQANAPIEAFWLPQARLPAHTAVKVAGAWVRKRMRFAEVAATDFSGRLRARKWHLRTFQHTATKQRIPSGAFAPPQRGSTNEPCVLKATFVPVTLEHFNSSLWSDAPSPRRTGRCAASRKRRRWQVHSERGLHVVLASIRRVERLNSIMPEPAAKRCKLAPTSVSQVQLARVQGTTDIHVSFTLPAEAVQQAELVEQFLESGATCLPASTPDVLYWLAATLQHESGLWSSSHSVQGAYQEGLLRVSRPLACAAALCERDRPCWCPSCK
jgi:predicted component of type VI protein secretion system